MDPELVYTLLGEKSVLPLLGMQPQFLDCPVCSPVTIPNEVFQLPCKFTVFTRTLSGNFTVPHLKIVHKDIFCVGI